MIYEIIDVQDTWDGAIQKINETLMSKAKENGIPRSDSAGFQFKEFDFATSQRKDPKACQECLRNLMCRTHAFRRTGGAAV
jgi:hypothetical protein